MSSGWLFSTKGVVSDGYIVSSDNKSNKTFIIATRSDLDLESPSLRRSLDSILLELKGYSLAHVPGL